MSSYRLTVVTLEADTVDVTNFDGIPRIMIARVRVEATNGAITVTRKLPLAECPHIGDVITVDLADDEDGAYRAVRTVS